MVTRYLEGMGANARPRVLVYEHAHLRGTIRARLAAQLRAMGMARSAELAAALHAQSGRSPREAKLSAIGRPWVALRHVLGRIDVRDNSVWIVNDTMGHGLVSPRRVATRVRSTHNR